jgi:SAM-dependent methyltransferase
MTSPSWNGGYTVSAVYPIHYSLELAPEHLNYACLRNGAAPLPLDRPYTYFELGCGQGFSTNIVAASNPQGSFYANDFMPDHIVHAQQLVDAAQLGNLQLFEHSFAELADGKVDLPQFDFITLHGVYAWISLENQEHIVRFLARYLKSGGVVYIAYNALPGWAAAMHMQRLMHLSGQLQPSASSHVKLGWARQLVQQMVGAKSKYFAAHPDLQFFLDALHKQPDNYLIHEYLHADSNPKYHADVVTEFARAKLEYLASAHLDEVDQTPTTPPEILQAITDPTLARTIEDFMLNTKFRKDIFTRGKRPLLKGEALQYYAQCVFALSVPEHEALSKLPKMAPAIALLAQTPRSLFEIAQWPQFGGQLELALDFTTLLHVKQLGFMFMPFPEAKDPQPAQRLNRELARRSCFEDQYPVLASPLLGTGIPASRIERLVYWQLCEQPLKSIAGPLPKLTCPDGGPDDADAASGGLANSDAQTIVSAIAALLQGPDAPTLEALTIQVTSILQSSLPMWRQLQVI